MINSTNIIAIPANNVGFVASVPEHYHNVLDLDFEILEKNDGASVQVIYAGSPQAEIKVVGSIVGAEKIEILKTYADPSQMPILTSFKEAPISEKMVLITAMMVFLYIIIRFILQNKYPIIQRNFMGDVLVWKADRNSTQTLY
jgi:hypothetical protein